jgi:hypothetical protein
LGMTGISKKAGEMWRAMTDDERKVYKDKAEAEKAEIKEKHVSTCAASAVWHLMNGT